jgi:hypothetical protein
MLCDPYRTIVPFKYSTTVLGVNNLGWIRSTFDVFGNLTIIDYLRALYSPQTPGQAKVERRCNPESAGIVSRNTNGIL